MNWPGRGNLRMTRPCLIEISIRSYITWPSTHSRYAWRATIWPMVAAIAAGKARVTGSRELASNGSLADMSGTPVEGFDAGALRMQERKARQGDDEGDEEEGTPVEAEIARVGSVTRRRSHIHAAE